MGFFENIDLAYAENCMVQGLHWRIPNYQPNSPFHTYEAGWHGPDHRTSFTFLVNRVEHQNEPKRPQSGSRLGSFWCSTRPSADTLTDYNLHHALKSVNRSEGSERFTVFSAWCRF